MLILLDLVMAVIAAINLCAENIILRAVTIVGMVTMMLFIFAIMKR